MHVSCFVEIKLMVTSTHKKSKKKQKNRKHQKLIKNDGFDQNGGHHELRHEKIMNWIRRLWFSSHGDPFREHFCVFVILKEGKRWHFKGWYFSESYRGQNYWSKRVAQEKLTEICARNQQKCKEFVQQIKKMHRKGVRASRTPLLGIFFFMFWTNPLHFCGFQAQLSVNFSCVTLLLQ